MKSWQLFKIAAVGRIISKKNVLVRPNIFLGKGMNERSKNETQVTRAQEKAHHAIISRWPLSNKLLYLSGQLITTWESQISIGTLNRVGEKWALIASVVVVRTESVMLTGLHHSNTCLDIIEMPVRLQVS
jgi:hypothetical protein